MSNPFHLREKAESQRQSGQAVLEMVMLMGVVLVVWIGVSRTLKERGVFQRLFGDSWSRLDNTIQYGVPTGKKSEASSNLPGTQRRIATRTAKAVPNE